MPILKARTEFALALNQVCHERGIEPADLVAMIEEAVLAAYRKDFGVDEEHLFEVKIDPDTGETKIYSWSEGKENKKKEVTPPGFGRIAAQVARQVILQKIREAEKNVVLADYEKRLGSLANGMVLRFDGPNVIFDIGKAEGWMLPADQIKSEHYHLNQRLTLYLDSIQETVKGRQIIVSRASKDLVTALFKREVPEVASGAVEIKEIAREPGERTKIAVVSTQSGVDPVGSCVGQKGVRVQAVINELNGEKIDVIAYSDEIEKFIKAALSPAENIKLKLDQENREAVISVPEDQLSLAIGRGGQNVRLAGRLTGYKIDIKGADKVLEVKKEPSAPQGDLKELGLSTRIVGLLAKAGVADLAALRKTKEKDLKKIKGLGEKSFADIKKKLEDKK